MIVRQAANVLEIFEFFARIQRPAALAEIADHFGWPRSSTFNLLSTLSEKGFLYEPQGRAGFYPTPRWLMLATTISNSQPLPAWTHNLIVELAADTGETTAIAGPSGTMAVFLDVVESASVVRYFAQVGHHIPIHASSSGRALLTQYSPTERNAIYRKIEFKQYHPSTPISIDAVETELRRSQERGYYQSFSDFSKDLTGVSLPLPISERKLAVVVAGPDFRMRPRIAEIAAMMHKALQRHSTNER